MKIKRLLAIALAAGALVACTAGGRGGGTTPEGAAVADAPSAADAFSADTAYALVAAQTAMGPRTPGSEGHARCVAWMSARLRAAGADTVVQQRGSMQRWDGEELPVCTVIAGIVQCRRSEAHIAGRSLRHTPMGRYGARCYAPRAAYPRR